MGRLQSQWKMSHALFQSLSFRILKEKKLKIYLKDEYFDTILVPSVPLSAFKSTGTVFKHWGPCTHLETKMQIKKTKIFFCPVSITSKDEAGVRCNHKSFKSSQKAAEPMRIGKNPALDFAGFCVVLKPGSWGTGTCGPCGTKGFSSSACSWEWWEGLSATAQEMRIRVY